MKAIRIGLAAAAAVVLLLTAQMVIAQDLRQERVRFKAGAASAVVKGSIKGREGADYLLGAAAGQTMHVTLKTRKNAYFNVIAPGADEAIFIGSTLGPEWTGTLPASGDYTVRVYLLGNDRDTGVTAPFTLTFAISGAPAGKATASDAKVADTPYHATGKVPCSIGPDPKGSAQCAFGVIRGDSGNAEVHLASPGFSLATPGGERRVLTFKGNAVTTTDAGARVQAEKQGDEWSIGINDFEFYTIPEAVIIGG